MRTILFHDGSLAVRVGLDWVYGQPDDVLTEVRGW